MKFIFKYIKELFTSEVESEFELSEEDLCVLKNIETGNTVSFEEDLSEYDLYLNKLLSIYNEVNIVDNKYEPIEINYGNSDTYYDLIGESSKVKISYLYFLLNIVNNTPKEVISHFQTDFLSIFFTSILVTELNLKVKDFDNFFFFENKNWKYNKYSVKTYVVGEVDEAVINFKISREMLLKKMIDFSVKSPLSKRLLYFLKSGNKSKTHPTITEYLYKGDVYRVLINQKYLGHVIPFFLLPDYFGEQINKLLLKSEEIEAIRFSELLKLLSSRSNIKNGQEEKIADLVEKLGLDFFRNTCFKMLELVAGFKSRVRLDCYTYTEKECYKSYSTMFIENTIVVFELLKLLQRLSLINQLPLSILITIIKRSHVIKDSDLRLGGHLVKTGSLCIKILATNFNENGVTALRNIYNETKYKRLKNKIIKEIRA